MRQNCKMAADQIFIRYGTVHLLVNNIGIQHVSAIEVFPEEMQDEVITMMLTTSFLLTRYG